MFYAFRMWNSTGPGLHIRRAATGIPRKPLKWMLYLVLGVSAILLLSEMKKYTAISWKLLKLVSNAPQDNRPKWVILHTYMRSGSTLLGTMIDQNRDAFYWFEPIYGVYHAAIGLWRRVHPIKIYSFANHTHYRTATEFENTAVTSYLKNLLSCNLDKIPLEFFLVSFTGNSRVGKTYMSCMRPSHVQQSRKCWHLLPKGCTDSQALLNQRHFCHIFLTAAHKAKNLNNSWYDSIQNPLPFFKNESIQHYIKCVEPLHQQHKICISDLQQICNNSTIRATKLIRSNQNLTRDILRNENSYIVHLIRDPRGILMSRKRLKILSDPDITKEAEVLCKKMLKDRLLFKKLQESGQRILSLKYEDIPLNPQMAIKRVYNFLNQTISSEVGKFFETLSGQNIKEHAFSIQRKNGNKTAHLWRKKIPAKLKKLLDKTCEQFLMEAEYEI